MDAFNYFFTTIFISKKNQIIVNEMQRIGKLLSLISIYLLHHLAIQYKKCAASVNGLTLKTCRTTSEGTRNVTKID